jgi:hypothetical protein
MNDSAKTFVSPVVSQEFERIYLPPPDAGKNGLQKAVGNPTPV